MNSISKIIVSVLAAIVLAGLYSSWSQSGSFGFSFQTGTSAWFVVASLAGFFIAKLDFAAGKKGSSPATTSRRTSSTAGSRQSGSVKWFNGAKGFGFISCENGEEIFVHFRSVRKDSPRLSPGKRVEFVIIEGKKGPEADDVSVH